jgi:hypothetical protein
MVTVSFISGGSLHKTMEKTEKGKSTFTTTLQASEWLLFNAKWAVFQLHHCKNKLHSIRWGLRWYHTLQVNFDLLFNFFIFWAVCLDISTVINIKILTNSNQQTQSYKFTSHIAAFLSVVLITEMLEICIQTWSKRSTDFKELSPCSVWYHLKSALF